MSATWQTSKAFDIIKHEQKELHTLFDKNQINLTSMPFSHEHIRNILSEWAWFHSNIKVSFDNTLTQTQEAFIFDPFTHKLVINQSMQIADLPKLIVEINKYTFWDKTPEYAAEQEMLDHLKAIIWYLYDLEDKTEDIGTAIKKYQDLLYKTYNSTDTISSKLSWYESDSLFMQKLKIKKNWPDIEELFAQETIQKTFESFYENGANTLLNMPAIQGNLNLDIYKSKLQLARSTNNKNKIAEQEKIIIQEIIEKIQKSSLNRDVIDWTYLQTSVPSAIEKSKDISCVWLSILLNQIFNELHIDHKWVIIKQHSAIIAVLSNWQSYYCDASTQGLKSFYKIDYNPNLFWNQNTILDKDTISTTFWDPENVIMSQIIYNKSVSMYVFSDKKEQNEKISYLRMLLSIEPRNHAAWHQVSIIQKQLWQKQKALDAINVAITLDWNQRNYWYEKYLILGDMNNFGIEYDKAKQEYMRLRK